MKPGCCKDKITILKANDDLAKEKPINVQYPERNIHIDFRTQNEILPSRHIISNFSGYIYPPPCPSSRPIYLLDGVFRI